MRAKKVCEKCETYGNIVKTYSSPHSPISFRLCNLCRDELKAELEGEKDELE